MLFDQQSELIPRPCYGEWQYPKQENLFDCDFRIISSGGTLDFSARTPTLLMGCQKDGLMTCEQKSFVHSIRHGFTSMRVGAQDLRVLEYAHKVRKASLCSH